LGREIYTGKPIPLAWALVNSKKEEAYNQVMNMMKNIMKLDHNDANPKW